MKAIENNANYQTYAIYKIYNIPREMLCEIINVVLIEASRNMGNEFNDKMLDSIIGTIEENHHNLPLCYITSAIYKGSMGTYGPGRLMPRTVFNWLREVSLEYTKEVDHKEIEERLKNTGVPVDLKKYPMGTALNLKIDWLTSGAINGDDWNIINLKELAEMIGKKQHPQLHHFFLTDRCKPKE